MRTHGSRIREEHASRCIESLISLKLQLLATLVLPPSTLPPLLLSSPSLLVSSLNPVQPIARSNSHERRKHSKVFATDPKALGWFCSTEHKLVGPYWVFENLVATGICCQTLIRAHSVSKRSAEISWLYVRESRNEGIIEVSLKQLVPSEV
jgi:hypothetical protein